MLSCKILMCLLCTQTNTSTHTHTEICLYTIYTYIHDTCIRRKHKLLSRHVTRTVSCNQLPIHSIASYAFIPQPFQGVAGRHRAASGFCNPGLEQSRESARTSESPQMRCLLAVKVLGSCPCPGKLPYLPKYPKCHSEAGP